MDADLTFLMEAEPYSVPSETKAPLMARGLERLTEHHRARGQLYGRMLDAGWPASPIGSIEAAPWLPVRLFKALELRSIPEEGVFRVMTSSGTTGQAPSRIFLDLETARLQTRALSSIATHFLGHRRLPMLIVDQPAVLRDRRRYSARTAGVLGMMNFGRDHLFLLDDDMRLDRATLEAWLARHAGEDLLIFGFTFMVWNDLLGSLEASPVDLSRATLVHSGGWKKLADQAVSKREFARSLGDALGIATIHDFYGMVEQVGSVYFECGAGTFHAPNFADVIIRDPVSWEALGVGRPGVIEVVSLLPRSYPGHALLTEDMGVLHGEDDCPCGGLGRRFEVLGRIPRAEVRGCSDTQVRAAA